MRFIWPFENNYVTMQSVCSSLMITSSAPTSWFLFNHLIWTYSVRICATRRPRNLQHTYMAPEKLLSSFKYWLDHTLDEHPVFTFFDTGPTPLNLLQDTWSKLTKFNPLLIFKPFHGSLCTNCNDMVLPSHYKDTVLNCPTFSVYTITGSIIQL